MNYAIQISKQAEKEIKRIPNPFYQKVKLAILALSTNPRPHGCKNYEPEKAIEFVSATFALFMTLMIKL